MLQADQSVLVIIDVQGKLATLMQDQEQLYRNLVMLVRGAKALGVPVICNEQVPDKLGSTIPELIEALGGDASPLPKKTFSCCGNPEFMSAFRALGRSQALLVGIETHVCVFQTARELKEAGVEVHVAADAVSSRTAGNRAIALDRMRQAGITITSTEMALFEWTRIAEGEAFRQIARLVK